MAVSDDFRAFALEQLVALPAVTWRRMFGGVGLYSRGAFFGVIDDDVLYFRVDDATRPAYEKAGSRAFAPIPGQQPMRGYYEVPADVVDDREEMVVWARRAVTVARAAERKPPAKKKTKKKKK